MQKLTIQIVGWNSAKHLRGAVTALKRIPQDMVVIRYIDNASTDNSIEVVRSALTQADIIELSENIGFAGAHNVAFAKCDTEYVLTHDPDVEIDWDGLLKLIDYMDVNAAVGAVQGKLLRKEADIVDSAGIELTLTLNGRERGAGEQDSGQFDTEAELDAVTGACGLYRMKAIREVMHGDTEFFDEQFFAYKEDVDLGWRLKRAGWKNMYMPYDIGRHSRTLGKRGMIWVLNREEFQGRLKSPRTRYSLRNYVWMLVKNASWKQWLLHGIFIELRFDVLFILSLFSWPLFKTWVEIFRELPTMLKKRKI